MSPVTTEISKVAPDARRVIDERSRATPIPPSDQGSFAKLLYTRQVDAKESDCPSPPAPEAEAPSVLVTVWEQMRFLATATVSKRHWRAGRQVSREPASTSRSDASSYARPLSLDSRRAVDPDDAPPVGQPLSLDAYPRPASDNGWGMHWIPTLYSSPEVVDRFVAELKRMGIKWTVLLNNGTDIGANDYLVQRLSQNGIMPVMRIYTPGLVPIAGDLEAMVRHYRELGVSYFQLYNEPNLELENGGQQPDVNRYLDLWIPAAKRVLAAGGLPGFGALSPNGEFEDCQFLRDALEELKERGEEWVLDRGWLSMHNYAGALPMEHPDGFLRFRRYAQILRDHLGRLIPIIGTEAGSYVTEELDQPRQVDLVTGAYRYMETQREPYNFAYTYWIVANREGGGKDNEFEWQALFKPGGWISPLVKALKLIVGER